MGGREVRRENLKNYKSKKTAYIIITYNRATEQQNTDWHGNTLIKQV